MNNSLAATSKQIDICLPFTKPAFLIDFTVEEVIDHFYDNIRNKNVFIYIDNDNKKKAILIIHYFGSKNYYTKFKNFNFIKIEDFSHLFLNKKLIKKNNNYIFASLRKHTHLRYGAWINKKFDIDEIDKKTKNFIVEKQEKLLSIKNKDEFQLRSEKFNKIIEKKYILKKLTTDLQNNFLKVNWGYIRNQRVKNFKDTMNYVYDIEKIPSIIDMRYRDGVALSYGK